MRQDAPVWLEPLEPRLLLSGNDPIISEFMALNNNGLADVDGDYSDWIEIWNPDTASTNLQGWHLTDDPANLSKWEFPSVSIGAGGYLVVFASEKNRAVSGQQLHTNFHLDAQGEYLGLVKPDGTTVVSSYPTTTPDQEVDISYGIDQDASGTPIRYFATPSPGQRNARSEVVINEIHYDPDVKTQLVEFIELYNPGSRAVDLSNAYFSSGVTYTFPSGATLAPNGYYVITENSAQFQSKFGVAAQGQYTGKLSNEGNKLLVRNSSGGKLDEVNYGAGFPWPCVGDPPGFSIELINPDFDNDLGGNWRSHVDTPGSDITYISSSSSWKYKKGTAEASSPASKWRELWYSESGQGWTSATLPIGYDSAPGITLNTTLADMNGSYSSVFLRKTFTVTDAGQINTLRLEALYDDGFNVWINGAHVLRQNLPADEMAYNGLASVERESNSFQTFYLPSPGNYLVDGTNVIAVEFHNVALSNPDAFFDARLIGNTNVAGVSPTPGRQNSVYAANAAPAMRQLTTTPQQPAAGQTVTITVKVTDPQGVAGVDFQYQIVEPGSYVEINDPAYQTNWTTLAMNDAGTGGDAVAGDGVYTVQLPGPIQVNRRLIRYRVTAADALGASITAPYPDDPVPNFAYYVYNGVPAWTGAAQPGVTQPVTYDTTVMNSLPVYTLIAKNADVEDGTWLSRYMGDNYLWRGTLVYDGVVYDHISFRARGGVWRYSMGKNMWKFDFNHNHEFQAKDDYGNPFDTKWGKLNLGASIQQGNFWNRGEQGLYEAVSFMLYSLAGVPAENTAFIQFRVVDNASETGATQYDGDLWGLYLAVEQVEGSFLDEHGLEDGNLYKMEGGTGSGGGTLNNQGPTQPSDNSDLVSFTSTYTNTTPTDQWWRDNLDLEEYYNFRAVTEATHNGDIGYGKNYFYYHDPVDNRWQIIPWDLDLTWGDNMYGDGNDPFKNRVLPRAAFNLEYKNRLRELRDLLLNTEQTGQVIDEMAAKIWTSGQPSVVDMDRAMWDYNPIMVDPVRVDVGNGKAGQGRFYAGGGGVVIPPPGGFPGMIQKMKNYIIWRCTTATSGWPTLDSLDNDPDIPNTPTVTALSPSPFPADDLRFRSSAFSDGTGTFAAMEWRIAEITDPGAPGYDPKAPKHYEIDAAWQSGELTTYASDVKIPVGAAQPGHTYRVRVRMKDSTGRWSHWSNGVQFVAGPGTTLVKDSLRIVEMDYNPSDPPTGSSYGNDDFEFIELKNIGAQTINVDGVSFTLGITYTFPALSVSPGQIVLVVKDQAAFASRYDTTGMTIAGAYLSGNLSNAGEEVKLVDGLGQTILDFTYLDSWYPTTDGGGRTLVVVNQSAATTAWNDPANWKASRITDGTPGTDESTLPDGAIVVNEALTHSDAPTGDWIELYNTTNTDINIGGWYVSDSTGTPRKYRIAPGTILVKHQYVVFNERDNFGAAASDPGRLVGFGFSELGEKAVLSSANSLGVMDGYQQVQEFAGSDKEVPFARYLNSQGNAYLVAESAATPREANAPPRIGPVVINELMYGPAVGGDEFIELRNISGSPVPLYDPLNPTHVWQFTAGVTFAFPQGVTLGSGEYVLVVPIAPATFRTKYNVNPAIRIFGPYTGTLDNAGEKIEISKPGDPEPDGSYAFYVVDLVDYGVAAPWPTTPNGGGPSLARINSGAFGCEPANWGPDAMGGSPGQPNFSDQYPTVSIADVSPDPRTTPVSSIAIAFSETVTGFDMADLSLTCSGSPVSLSTATLTTTDNVTWTLGNLAGLTSLSGVYVLTLTAAGSGIQDLTGNPLLNGDSDSFTVDTVPPAVAKVMVSGSSWSTAFTNYLRSNNMGDGGYAVPVGSGVQLKPLPWVNINMIKVVFNDYVIIDSADLLLSGVRTPTYAVSMFSYDNNAKTATWILSGSVPSDKVILELNADGPDPIRDLVGHNLDGEWTNPTSTGSTGTSVYPSGNGVAGGNFCFRFNVLPGDVNQNGVVQSNDGLLVRAALGTSTVSGGLYSVYKDVNANAIVQANDGLSVRSRLGSSLPTGEPTGGMGGASAPLSEAGELTGPLSAAPLATGSTAFGESNSDPTTALSTSLGTFDVLAAAEPMAATPSAGLTGVAAASTDGSVSLEDPLARDRLRRPI